MPLSHALQGLRVLDLTRLVPGPFGTLILADFGADVVKIEQPGVGDYLRMLPPLLDGIGARFRAVNRGKRSVALDLGCDAGREVLLRLARDADVVVEGFRPGVVDRLGIGFEALCEVKPDTILCSISGYGQTGPYRARAGHDINYLALSGLLAELGGDRTPRPLPVQIADLVGGGLYGVVAILAGLEQRRREGGPLHLDISMTEGVMALIAAELADLLAAGEGRPCPGEALLTGGLATYRVYPTADDKLFAVGALEPKFSGMLGPLLGFEARADDMLAGPQRQQELGEQIGRSLASRTRDAWMEVLGEHDVCCEPALALDELADHPQHQARGVFRPGDTDGSLSADGPVHTPCTRVGRHRVAPRLGEHTREVLREAGYPEGQIDALVSDNVVA
jgi:crotonobetainyl-CoA:carnitine CoA-transferase CaiB-like acyl-CoA transferase